MLSALVVARAALLPTFGDRLFVRGDHHPDDQHPLLVLEGLSETSMSTYGLQPSRAIVQLSVFDLTTARALENEKTARRILHRKGFRHLQTVAGPEMHSFVSTFTIKRS